MKPRAPSNPVPSSPRTKDLLKELHRALIDIVIAMNRPQQDEELIREAGISLDRALFRALVVVERLGPIGVVDLASRVGVDYTTVSRQVTKLEKLGLLTRQKDASDGRTRRSVVTPKGKEITALIDSARERMARRTLVDWDEEDLATLTRLMVRFAGALTATSESGS